MENQTPLFEPFNCDESLIPPFPQEDTELEINEFIQFIDDNSRSHQESAHQLRSSNSILPLFQGQPNDPRGQPNSNGVNPQFIEETKIQLENESNLNKKDSMELLDQSKEFKQEVFHPFSHFMEEEKDDFYAPNMEIEETNSSHFGFKMDVEEDFNYGSMEFEPNEFDAFEQAMRRTE